MRAEILTVMWKEWRGLLRSRGRRGQAIVAVLFPILLAVYLPLQEGGRWFENALSILPSIVIPLIVVGITVPDSFAGERERHTLPTLLASRLSDRAILWGKLATTVLFGWGVATCVLLMSLLVANVVSWSGRVMFFRLPVFVADLGISLLMSLLTASAGVLFSLRASTVQEAQQTLMGVLMVPPMLLQFAAMWFLGSESGKASLEEFLGRASFEQIMLIVGGFMLLLVVILVLAGMARFRRAKLILS